MLLCVVFVVDVVFVSLDNARVVFILSVLSVIFVARCLFLLIVDFVIVLVSVCIVSVYVVVFCFGDVCVLSVVFLGFMFSRVFANVSFVVCSARVVFLIVVL